MTPDFSPRKAAFYTLGCKLNFAETSTIGKILSDRGFRRALPEETPDICVVNTCSVTEMADKKGRSLIRRLSRQWPSATLVVTGCYAQLKPEEVAAIEGVDIVLGSNEKLRIAEYLDRWEAGHAPIVESTRAKDITVFRPSCERGDRTRYWLKVQDGCDYYCTYCTIPFARGRSRSGLTADLVRQAREAAEAGGREIVLTGVNIGEFGKDTGESLLGLLKELDAVEGIERYRISSIEPNLLTEEIIDWVASESRAFMPHFHIPLQSGSDTVLRLMNRRYDTALFASRIAAVRRMIPDAFIGVDVIAGARGETPEEWERSVEFIRSLPVTRLHVFPYSERPGTAALMMDAPEVAPAERHNRAARLQNISDGKLEEYFRSMTGQVRPVLWEHVVADHNTDNLPSERRLMSGLTDNYLRVVAPARPELINTVSRVRITGIDPERDETLTAIHAD
ncbi:MAG: tRNA (N(6)-L-threonylcarbamoyladenosine(37)-C(2))-methylthiotransferase MtaB [Muribaculaceae bacterium]|nr:tRNA (N(6)-L-threonylcarbamoyladenosine(37)-C(2))-methylthiotransferase MtaB [Muribaculaceae bacterium]MDE7082026.1 tRNA (N(6)-L-threonylcarbamoyladenosine(37)-C(2))-methylthiotransferase MtaB [Muribaculaceae bacterium]